VAALPAQPPLELERPVDKAHSMTVEWAIYIGKGNEPGESISLATAEQHVFGIGLLNDWSDCDIQASEMQPLVNEVMAKRPRLLHDLMPKAVRVAVLLNPEEGKDN
jgi:2-keto-4-pentenoate hydratase/2-oxohepta-3-ene-1,7-dioic acid hydratase in catechol pathway